MWLFDENKGKFMKNMNEVYLNQPINNVDSDAINIEAYVDQIDKAINLGAKSIAITSDFGAGKSSLVKTLEKRKNSLFYKFCYVNMWSHLTENCDNIELHKTFIYQLANQISKKKGQYVSKRINENYGLFNIRANSATKQMWLMISMFFVIIGFAFTEFYDKYTKVILSSDFFINHNTEIGIISFVFAALIIMFLLFNTDVVFSSNKSDAKIRKIDENEIMDIYNSYILKRSFCLKKYIVVIEDLDRTENYKAVMQFLKELRKYYISEKSNIVFIVNIKPEGLIKKDFQNSAKNPNVSNRNNEEDDAINTDKNNYEECEIFPKIFDYILDLKTINYLNYDKIILHLLEEKEKYLENLGLSIWKNKKKKELISDFEWIILSRDRNIGIREIKERLNYSISIYHSFKSKFPKDQVSYKKCAVAAYLQSAYSYEYYAMIDVGIDKILDIYAKDKNISSENLQNALAALFGINNVSLYFAEDLLRILRNKCLEEDYRNYYYNIPKNSKIYSAEELKLINTIIYNNDAHFVDESSLKELTNLVNNVKNTNDNLLKEIIQKLDKLSLDYPLGILLNEDLLDIALKTTQEKVWNAIKNLDYKNDFLKTKSYLFRILSYDKEFNNSNFKYRILNNLLYASQKDIVAFRTELRELNLVSYEDYKTLYFGEFPLITIGELNASNNILESISLINYLSQELNYNTFFEINNYLSNTCVYEYKNYSDNMISFYKKINEVFKNNGERSISLEIMSYMKFNNIFIEELFEDIEMSSSNKELFDIFVELTNNFAKVNHYIPKYALSIIENNNTTEGLNIYVCEQLLETGLYDLYIKNMIFGKMFSQIEYGNKGVIETINQYGENFINEYLIELRTGIINSDINDFSVYNLFSSKYPIISRKLLFLIPNTEKALKIIPSILIDDDNYEYICQYLNRKGAIRRTVYQILKYIVSIKNTAIKKLVFEHVDFRKIHYNMISKDKKDEIIDGVRDIYNLSSPLGMIHFMSVTRVSNEKFEDYILSLDNKINIENSYVEYVNKLLKFNNRVIQVLLDLPHYHGFDVEIQNEFYNRGYYKYYVISKTLFDKYFSFEIEKINLLGKVYYDIFTTATGLDNIIQYMQQSDVIGYFIQQKYFKLIDDEKVIFRFAAYKKQSRELLYYVKENFNLEFVIKYYSNIGGFDGYNSARAFVDIIESCPNLAKQNSIYVQTHKMLLNGELKFKYTIAKRRAQKMIN